MNIWKERGFRYNVQRRLHSPADRLVVLLYVVDLTVFCTPQNGGVARGAVQRKILFPLKAYSLWNLCKAAALWRCTTCQCWLNCRSTLQRNGHNFIGLDRDFIMTMHSLTSRITSCSFWINLTLPPYSPNLAPCDFFLLPSLKTKLQGIQFETSEAVLKKSEVILKDLTKNGLHDVFEEWQQCCKKCIQLGGEYFEKRPCKH